MHLLLIIIIFSYNAVKFYDEGNLNIEYRLHFAYSSEEVCRKRKRKIERNEKVIPIAIEIEVESRIYIWSMDFFVLILFLILTQP